MKIIETQTHGLDFHAKALIQSTLIHQEVKKELNKLSKTVKIKGFREGKVPLSLIDKKYGAAVRNEVIQKQINQAVNQIIKENNLNISSKAQIELIESEEKEAVAFTAKFELLPTISLPDFSKITLEKILFKIQDEDIDNELEQLRNSSKEYTEEKKGEVTIGDQVIINGEGYLNGKVFNGGKLENYKLVIGSKTFIDNFEEQLIGYKAGDHLTVNVTFPTNYGAIELAGKQAEFKVTIIAVYSPVLPLIEDEFVKKLGCSTLTELREKLAKSIERVFDKRIETLMKIRLFDALEPLLMFDVPESLLDKEYQALKKSLEEASSADEENSEEQNEEYYKKLVLRRVRIGLMLSEYMKAKDIRIENQEIKEVIIAMARQFPGSENKVIDFYHNNPSAIESLKGSIIERKTVAHILTHAVQTIPKEYTKQELEELIEKFT